MDKDLTPLFNKLTRLQKHVCLGVLEGKTQRQAYYDAGGLAKNDETADSCAHVMLSNDEVSAFMEKADGKAVTSAVMTKQEALERLTEMSKATDDDCDNFRELNQSILAALKELSSLLGWEAPKLQTVKHTGAITTITGEMSQEEAAKSYADMVKKQ